VAPARARYTRTQQAPAAPATGQGLPMNLTCDGDDARDVAGKKGGGRRGEGLS